MVWDTGRRALSNDMSMCVHGETVFSYAGCSPFDQELEGDIVATALFFLLKHHSQDRLFIVGIMIISNHEC